jgi:hypothetical protein
MAITALSVFTQVRALLDDDNSGRYSEANDLVPAVNAAIDFIVSVFNASFEQTKIAPESLSELSTVLLCDITIQGSTVKACLSDIEEYDRNDIWTIIGIEPNPSMDEGALVESRNRFTNRLSLEQWNDMQQDPFAAGTSTSIPSVFTRAASVGPGKFLGDGKDYIFIRPSSVVSTGDKVAIYIIKSPTEVVDNTSTIEFPRSLQNLLVQKTLQYMSYQHGDEKYFSYTDKDILNLVNLMK